jgi:alpha-ketoglutarate-dependent taurine dioxygenase
MEFTPLHPDFGVEVHGFDTARGGTPEEIAQLRDAYDRYDMLLFRGGPRLSGERQVEIASWFGPPPPVANGGPDDFVSVLANEDDAGRLQLEFHSDLTYTEVPIKGICLHAIDLPENGTSTSYVSNKAAWRLLPPELQAELADCTLRHSMISKMTSLNFPRFVAEHPVRLIHPRTGVPLLLVTEYHAERILELDEARSREVIEAIFAIMYAQERRYQHWWQLDDLLIWDNLALQHARTEEAAPSRGRRALQRVALSEAGLAELVERARAREATA